MNQKIEHALELIADCEEALSSVCNYFNFQLLSNADTLQGASGATKEIHASNVELLIKQPFRKQIGRMKGLPRIYAEARRELREGLEEYQRNNNHELSTVKINPEVQVS